MNKRLVTFAVAVATLYSVPASATILDISAADGTGEAYTFGSGEYLFEWIGTADGGKYDAAGGISLCPGCASGFSNALVARDSAFGTTDFELGFFTTRSVYGTAAESLAAYEAGTPIYHDWVRIKNGLVFDSGSDGLIPFPFMGDPDDGTYRFLVFDADGTRTNNTGGVSFRITPIGVPEPAAWAMMITGFGFVGATMRRKQRQTVRLNFA